jgi:nicotinate-nucleotide adenylyltransferase
MKIGIMGGTFDPIHHGHLIAAEYARESMKLDRIIFLPSGMHPFKNNKNITNSQTRVKMTKLAISSNPYFEISLMGVNRKDTSYTIDDIRDLKVKYPNDELYFIIGSDIIYEIEKWKEFNKLTKLCKFVLFDRWGKEEEHINKKIEELEAVYKLNIEKVESPLINISSTTIRNRRSEGYSIKYMVPKSVENYIIKYGIYLDEDINE